MRFRYTLILLAVATLFSCSKEEKYPELFLEVRLTGPDFIKVSLGVKETGTVTGASYGVVASQSPNPNKDDILVRFTSNGVYSIDGLETGRTYYIRPVVWLDNDYHYGEEITATTSQFIELNFNGQVLQTPISGNLSSQRWSFSLTFTGANSDTDGKSNTQKIVSKLPNETNAAHYCNNLFRDGFGDWYLPSIGELRAFVQQGAFENTAFGFTFLWSSTEINASNAIRISTADGTEQQITKQITTSCLCIRKKN